MASITFSGQLDQAMNEAAAAGNKILFIPQQTVGEVLPGAASELVVESDGLYSITLSYNTYSIYHYSDVTKRRTLLATDIVVSADTAVSTIPDLIGSTVPVTEDSVLTIQGYLTDAQNSATAAATSETNAAASEAAVSNRVAAYEVESTEYLINTFDGSALGIGDVIRTLGYYTAGDGGGTEWVKTGNTGVASQSPADLDSLSLNDTNGDEYEPSYNKDSRSIGMIGDGVTDNTVLLGVAVRNNILIHDGTYVISDMIELPEDVLSVDLKSNANIIQTVPLPIFYRRGSMDMTGFSSLSDVITKGDTYITTDVEHSFEEGDYIYFRCNDLTPNVTAGSRISCIRKIADTTSGESWLRVDKAFYRDMSSSITLRKMLMAPTVKIKGGIFEHSSPVDCKLPLFYFYNCLNPIIDSVTLRNNGGPAILLQNCFGGRFVNSDIYNLLNGTNTDSDGVESSYYGYGIQFAGATRDFQVISGSIGECRHGVTTSTITATDANIIPDDDESTVLNRGEPEGITVESGVLVYNTSEAGLDTHEQGYDIVFKPNVTGCLKGVQIRADDVTVMSGSIRGCRRYAMVVSNPASNPVTNPTLYPKIKNIDINVVGEDGSDGGTESKGVMIFDASHVVSIDSLNVAGCKEESIYVQGGTNNGNYIIMRNSTIDGSELSLSEQVGIKLETSGSYIETTTVKNLTLGLSEASSETNTTSIFYLNNTTDEQSS